MYSIKEALGLSDNASSYEIERAVRLNPEPLVDLRLDNKIHSKEIALQSYRAPRGMYKRYLARNLG